MKTSYTVAILVVIAVIVCAAVLLPGREAPGEPSVPGIENILENHEAGGKVAIYHWWTAGGEREGFDRVTDVMAEFYPNIDIVPTPVAGGAGGAMVTKVKTEIISGNPPESFQCHPGYELYPYYEADALRSLNDLWARDNIEERVPEFISRICRVGENYYVVPIGVHLSLIHI